MTVTTSTLTRAAGAAAATAGAIFIGVQIGHPAMEVESVTSTEWAVRNTAKVVMCALALAGITGMYLRQVRQTRLLGLAGYLVFSVGFFMMLSIAFVAGFVLPSVAGSDPAYVDDVLTVAGGGTAAGDIGWLQAAFTLSGVGYMGGGLLFGIALFRARVLTRWAAALLAVATTSTVLLAVLPHSFDRPFAVPAGVALIGLGISLWRSVATAAAPAEAPVAHAVR